MNGMGLGRIPWHECYRIAEWLELDEEEAESLRELIDRLDLEEHKIADEEAENRKKKGKKNGTDGTPST